jgi:predicted kinase
MKEAQKQDEQRKSLLCQEISSRSQQGILEKEIALDIRRKVMRSHRQLHQRPEKRLILGHPVTRSASVNFQSSRSPALVVVGLTFPALERGSTMKSMLKWVYQVSGILVRTMTDVS